MKRLLMFLVILGFAGVGARAQYREVPDVPTDLLGIGPTTRLPWDIVDNAGGIYSVVASLPPLTPVDAIHELPAGGWLVSVEVATDLAFVTWDRRDVFFWDGGIVYAPYPPYGGALALIPLGSHVDAVLLDQTAAVVVSFDVPTTIGPVTYDPADLVRYNGVTFDAIPYFDASAAGPLSETDFQL